MRLLRSSTLGGLPRKDIRRSEVLALHATSVHLVDRETIGVYFVGYKLGVREGGDRPCGSIISNIKIQITNKFQISNIKRRNIISGRGARGKRQGNNIESGREPVGSLQSAVGKI